MYAIRSYYGHPYRAGRTDPTDIIAQQIDDHQVLGSVLGRGGQFRGLGRIGHGIAIARPGTLDGFGLHLP